MIYDTPPLNTTIDRNTKVTSHMFERGIWEAVMSIVFEALNIKQGPFCRTYFTQTGEV
jgi:hypothetical protein